MLLTTLVTQELQRPTYLILNETLAESYQNVIDLTECIIDHLMEANKHAQFPDSRYAFNVLYNTVHREVFSWVFGMAPKTSSIAHDNWYRKYDQNDFSGFNHGFNSTTGRLDAHLGILFMEWYRQNFVAYYKPHDNFNGKKIRCIFRKFRFFNFFFFSHPLHSDI